MNQELINAFKDKQTKLRRSMKKAKRLHWNTLMEKLDEDAWVDGYTIATKDLRVLIQQ